MYVSVCDKRLEDTQLNLQFNLLRVIVQQYSMYMSAHICSNVQQLHVYMSYPEGHFVHVHVEANYATHVGESFSSIISTFASKQMSRNIENRRDYDQTTSLRHVTFWLYLDPATT